MAPGTRVMAGALKGQPIGPIPSSIFARPILARIRKSLFDILQSRVPRSRFLDLFSGSTTVGMEALSRGASEVVFVDKNPQCVRWAHQILNKLKSRNPSAFEGKRAEVLQGDALVWLSRLEGGFDIIFSGAPYKDEKRNALYFIDALLEAILRHQKLLPGGLFIAQHHIKEPFSVAAPWECFRKEKYGDTQISFFRLKS